MDYGYGTAVYGIIQEIENELQNNRNAIKELESSPNLTWVEQEELELQKQLKQDEQLDAAENSYKENLETFNKDYPSGNCVAVI
ncbi:MAG: hypothetical protein HDR11_03205 [Lachnospiraceae bacterium]|nr:hypothetical protein [Lachnospiraceae bacterium]